MRAKIGPEIIEPRCALNRESDRRLSAVRENRRFTCALLAHFSRLPHFWYTFGTLLCAHTLLVHFCARFWHTFGALLAHVRYIFCTLLAHCQHTSGALPHTVHFLHTVGTLLVHFRTHF